MSWMGIALINFLIWPVVHLLVSWWALGLDPKKFNASKFPFFEFRFERKGRFYEKLFFVKKWKNRLPDGAAVFGVKIEKGLKIMLDPMGRQKIFQETMRSEWAHWMTIGIGLLLVTFNSFKIWLIMLGYALIANLPCIIAQRYNRIKLRKLI